MAADTTGMTVRLFQVQAHRGGAGLAPENTLAAFRHAIALGVDALEMDLQVTRDGKVVVIHDDTLERTTDGRGRIADLTLAEIRRHDAGAKFSPAFRGERVPTLEEVIALVRETGGGRVRLNLELKFAKGQEGQPEDFEERVLAILRRTGVVEQVFVQSFHHPSPAKMKALEPRILIGLLVGERQPPLDPVALVRRHGADYYAPHFRLVTPELVATLHRAGIPVVTWTVNEEPAMRQLLDMGIGTQPGDGIISDYPDRLLTVRGAR